MVTHSASEAPDGRTPQLCDALTSLGPLAHYVLRADRTCKLVVAQRTSVAYESAPEIEASFRQVARLLADIPRGGYLLLVDTRDGPRRNDSTFEAASAAHRGKLLFGFARNAALAKTAAGRLQIQRFAKSDGRVVFATESPAAAFEYLGIPFHVV